MRDLPPAAGRLGSFDGAVADPPAKPRRIVIYAALLVLVGGSLVAIVRDDPYGKELWPFSAYPMYSQPMRGWSAGPHRLFGVLRDDPTREIPLIAGAYLYPIEHTRYYIALARIERQKDRDAALEAALRDTLARYELRRIAGLHNGPPLRGIRLYALKWRLDTSAHNRDRPDERKLLYEVSTP